MGIIDRLVAYDPDECKPAGANRVDTSASRIINAECRQKASI